MGIRAVRCNECRGYVQLKTEVPMRCPKCNSQRQTNLVGELTMDEQCQIYHRTGIMVLNKNTTSFQKLVLIAKATLTGKGKK